MRTLSTICKQIHLYWQTVKRNAMANHYKVDPSIYYPCYKSMDQYIDVDALKKLDKKIKLAIQNYIANKINNDIAFDTGPMTLKLLDGRRTKSRLIQLTERTGTYNYFDINNPTKWQLSDDAKQFDFYWIL
jgi:hypothetical protein